MLSGAQPYTRTFKCPHHNPSQNAFVNAPKRFNLIKIFPHRAKQRGQRRNRKKTNTYHLCRSLICPKVVLECASAEGLYPNPFWLKFSHTESTFCISTLFVLTLPSTSRSGPWNKWWFRHGVAFEGFFFTFNSASSTSFMPNSHTRTHKSLLYFLFPIIPWQVCPSGPLPGCCWCVQVWWWAPPHPPPHRAKPSGHAFPAGTY